MALQSVSGIVERRHTLPILANVLIRKSGAPVQLTMSETILLAVAAVVRASGKALTT